MKNQLFSTLRSRILIAVVGLVLLGMGSLGLLAGRQIATSVMADFANTLAVKALVLAGALVEPFEDGVVTPTVTNIVTRYAETAAVRVTLISADGVALLDSFDVLPSGILLQLPELSNAGIHEQRPDENGVEQIWTATTVVYEGQTVGYVRLAAPTAEPVAVIQQRILALVGAFLLLTLLSILLGIWLSSTLTRPLHTLQAAALKMADGDLNQRVPDMNSQEMSAVAQAFNEMAHQVQSMVAEQRAFAGNAAHELRTPITSIRLRAERLLTGNVDAGTAQEFIAEIEEEAIRMGGLVEDLTWLSRLDANRLEVGEALVDAGRVAAALAADLQTRAQKNGVTLTLETPSQLPPIKATINHVQVVLRNLLDNALKYTPSGGEVTCRLEQQGQNIHIIIADSGRGVAAKDVPHITQRFYRADQAHTRAVDGVGLGLSLVSSLLAVYEGRLEIESAGINQGATVTVIWPIAN